MARRTLLGLLVGLLAVVAVAVLVALPQGGVRLERAAAPAATPLPSRTPLLAPLPVGVPITSLALGATLTAPGLGGTLSASVVDTRTGTVLLDRGSATPATPASTNKIATAVAVLSTLDPTARLTTRVVQGAVPGDVVLVGAGDPTLAGLHPAEGFPQLASLAGLAAQLSGQQVTRVLVDSTLFSGPALAPGWKPDYVTTGNVAPVSALEVDEGRTSSHDGAPRSPTPALQAGRELASLLHVRTVATGVAPPGATVLASADSPTVGDLVESMLTRSDNDLAEALSRQVALQARLPATFAGATQAVRTALAALVQPGDLSLQDGSGLSRLDRIAPRALTALLSAVTRTPRLGAVLSGLPVAGFDGTLGGRFRTAPTDVAAGAVRGKTGTLDGVSALAGLVRTRSGNLLAFDLAADAVTGGRSRAQAALDRIAAALAAS